MNRRPSTPLLALAIALVLLAVIAVASMSSGGSDNDPSSHSAGRRGTLALYTWLDALGLQTQRLTGSLDVSGTDVLFVLDPTTAYTADEASRVADFVQGGGEVVVAFGPDSVTGAAELLSALRVAPAAALFGVGDAHPALPFDAADRVHNVPMEEGLVLADDPQTVPLLSKSGRTVAATRRLGAGRVDVVASPYPFSNDGLRREDSAFFTLALLERMPSGHVLRVGFDEVHHGEGSADGAAAIIEGPLGAALLLGALVVVVYLAASGRRLGRAVPPAATAPVPTAADLAVAMAQLMARSRRRGVVAARYADELKQRVGAATGVDWRLDDESFLRLISGYDEPQVAAAAAALRRARTLAEAAPSEEELLALATQVDAAEARYTLRS